MSARVTLSPRACKVANSYENEALRQIGGVYPDAWSSWRALRRTALTRETEMAATATEFRDAPTGRQSRCCMRKQKQKSPVLEVSPIGSSPIDAASHSRHTKPGNSFLSVVAGWLDFISSASLRTGDGAPYKLGTDLLATLFQVWRLEMSCARERLPMRHSIAFLCLATLRRPETSTFTS